ncbi:hypothetical protein ACB092_03G194900 [Castanea dentata]
MEEPSKGFVRADMLEDIKRIDEQLQRHLNRVWAMQNLDKENKVSLTQKQDWEIDSTKLIIKQVIAHGAFGTVYRGLYDGQDVAVKVLDWEEGQRTEAEIALLRTSFRQEVSVWHKLDHPNIAKFIGATLGTSGLKFQTQKKRVDMQNTAGCVIIEYFPCGTLKSYLTKNRERKLAFKNVVRIALDLANGLSYLHSRKIVHRDVKTENLLLDKNLTVKIIDFGVARLEASNPIDMTGSTGTLGYMAPEVLENKPYNRKCDVYSFGICLWEIYCCDTPYPNLKFSDLTSSVVYLSMRPDIPSCCPNSLAEIITRCWHSNPKRRPEMKEVVTMLKAIDTSKGKEMTPLYGSQGCLFFCCQ